MMCFRSGIILGLCLSFVAFVPAAEESLPKPPPSEGKDIHGDPLPRHARARLGTVRFHHGVPLTDLSFTPDGKSLISTGNDQSLCVWDPKTGKELFSQVSNEARSSPFAQSVNSLLSPDARVMATFDNISNLKVWDTGSGRLLHTLSEQSAPAASGRVFFTPDSKVLVSTGTRMKNNDSLSVLRVWELATGRELPDLELQSAPNAQGFGVNDLSFSDDGKLAVATGSNGQRNDVVRVWNMTTGKMLPVPSAPPVRTTLSS